MSKVREETHGSNVPLTNLPSVSPLHTFQPITEEGLTTQGLRSGHKSMIAHVIITRGRLSDGVGLSSARLAVASLTLTNDDTGVNLGES